MTTDRELPNTDALPCLAQANALGINSPDTFSSDNLWSYEVGAKGRLGDGRATFNAAAFYIDFEDIQQQIQLECGFQFIANIGSARSLGFELDGSIWATDNLRLEGAIGFTDAEFTEDVGAISDGDRLQQVPRVTATGSFDYTLDTEIISGSETFIRGTVSHVGNSISRTVDALNPRIRPGFEIANGRIGVKNDTWQAAIFVDNIFDTDAIFGDNRTLAAEALGRPRIVRNRPRTFGLDLRSNF